MSINLASPDQQPGESRQDWKNRTFALHYGMGAAKLSELLYTPNIIVVYESEPQNDSPHPVLETLSDSGARSGDLGHDTRSED